jgi:3-oxoacyl-[acyl-carrier protein] reductase
LIEDGVMDLGIRGRRAIVYAAGRGLGLACADALAAEGVALVLNARDEARLAGVSLHLDGGGGCPGFF